MASFRIIFPFLSCPNGDDLELNTVSGVSAQARLSPHLLPNCLSLWSTKYEAPRQQSPKTSAAQAWFHAKNKKLKAISDCDIRATNVILTGRCEAVDFLLRDKHLDGVGPLATRQLLD
jgi:hypothetical protein